jgi:hypothetical protein
MENIIEMIKRRDVNTKLNGKGSEITLDVR